MRGHLGASELENYRQRALPPSDLLEADRHLAGCSSCLEELRRWAPPKAPDWISEVEGSEHLSYEEMTAWLESRLQPNEAARMERHLSACSRCTADLRALRNVDAQLSGRGWEAWVQTLASLRQWLVETTRVPRLAWGHASALVLILAVAGSLSLLVGPLVDSRRGLEVPEGGLAALYQDPLLLSGLILLVLLALGALGLRFRARKRGKHRG